MSPARRSPAPPARTRPAPIIPAARAAASATRKTSFSTTRPMCVPRSTPAALEHTAVLGVSFTQEDYSLLSGNLLRTADGSTVAQPPISLSNPNTVYTGPVNFIRVGLFPGSTTTNAAVYLFDTVKVVPQLEFNVGLRYEKAKGTFRADTYSIAVGPTLGAYTRGADPGERRDALLLSRRPELQARRERQPLSRLWQFEDADLGHGAPGLRRADRAPARRHHRASVRGLSRRRRSITRSAPRRTCSAASCS